MPNSRVASTIALLTVLAVPVDADLAAQTTAPTAAPAAAAAPAAETFSKEQLEQLVAPIALYADSLLSQILMASTYPLEVVEADRFMKQNAGLKGTALDEKLKAEDWDATVKSLCTVPDVLAKMSENLDWTQDLGDAFLGQKTELMDTVQRMRGKANDSGNLKTTEQQVVTVQEDKIIIIESPSPEVVYVPTYSPPAVYGGWSYPSYYYPPMYPYYPPGAGLITFGVGMAMGAAIWGDCNWGWGGGDVNIDVDRYNNFNRNTNINADRTNLSGDRAGNRAGTTGNRAGTTGNRAGATSGNRASFQHDSSHRKGVNYKSGQTASQYGAKSGTSRVSSSQARGHSGASAGTRPTGTSASSRGSGTRPSTTASGQGAGTRGSGQGTASRGQGSGATGATSRSSGSSPSASQRSSGSGRSSSASPGSSAYSGSSRSSASSASSSRGSSSRGSRSYSGGGGSRGGGGRGGGGRGGRS